MANDMTWEDVVDYIDQVIELGEQVQAQDNISMQGVDFANSVDQTLNSMKEWVTENERYSPKQLKAIENIEAGLSKWIKDE
jgi:molecular chaperone DnaK (HSP70)